MRVLVEKIHDTELRPPLYFFNFLFIQNKEKVFLKKILIIDRDYRDSLTLSDNRVKIIIIKADHILLIYAIFKNFVESKKMLDGQFFCWKDNSI